MPHSLQVQATAAAATVAEIVGPLRTSVCVPQTVLVALPTGVPSVTLALLVGDRQCRRPATLSRQLTSFASHSTGRRPSDVSAGRFFNNIDSYLQSAKTLSASFRRRARRVRTFCMRFANIGGRVMRNMTAGLTARQAGAVSYLLPCHARPGTANPTGFPSGARLR